MFFKVYILSPVELVLLVFQLIILVLTEIHLISGQSIQKRISMPLPTDGQEDGKLVFLSFPVFIHRVVMEFQIQTFLFAETVAFF